MGAENGPDTVPKSPDTVPNLTQVTVREEMLDEGERRKRELGLKGAALETEPRRTRRVFKAADKLRIVKRADACRASGERGALEAMLRQEGIYSSLLSTWRGQLGALGAGGLEPRKVGRKVKLDAKDRLNAELTKRNAVLERKLHIADVLIELQKKAHEILNIALPAIGEEI
jgi:transposase-like protein